MARKRRGRIPATRAPVFRAVATSPDPCHKLVDQPQETELKEGIAALPRPVYIPKEASEEDIVSVSTSRLTYDSEKGLWIDRRLIEASPVDDDDDDDRSSIDSYWANPKYSFDSGDTFLPRVRSYLARIEAQESVPSVDHKFRARNKFRWATLPSSLMSGTNRKKSTSSGTDSEDGDREASSSSSSSSSSVCTSSLSTLNSRRVRRDARRLRRHGPYKPEWDPNEPEVIRHPKFPNYKFFNLTSHNLALLDVQIQEEESTLQKPEPVPSQNRRKFHVTTDTEAGVDDEVAIPLKVFSVRHWYALDRNGSVALPTPMCRKERRRLPPIRRQPSLEEPPDAIYFTPKDADGKLRLPTPILEKLEQEDTYRRHLLATYNFHKRSAKAERVESVERSRHSSQPTTETRFLPSSDSFLTADTDPHFVALPIPISLMPPFMFSPEIDRIRRQDKEEDSKDEFASIHTNELEEGAEDTTTTEGVNNNNNDGARRPEVIANHVAAIIKELGHGTSVMKKTPQRVAQALIEATCGYEENPDDVASTFQSSAADRGQLVTVGPLHLSSLCEHHLLPFFGDCYVGYVPQSGAILGLSKFSRIISVLSHRFQIQERLTRQIAEAIVRIVGSEDVAVLESNSVTVTTQFRGEFKSGDDEDGRHLQREFLFHTSPT